MTTCTFGDVRLPARFWAKVDVQANGCWLWTASIADAGYSQISDKPGPPVVAHKYAFERIVGPVPPTMTLDHACHTYDPTCAGGRTCLHRRCVNPSHLEVVSRGENVRRGRRWANAPRACFRGHDYGESDQNRYPNGGGCRLCRLERE